MEEDRQSVSFRNLQIIAPSILRKKLNSKGVLVVTVNNKTFAAIINLKYENAQELLLLVSRLRAQIVELSIRNQPRKDGMDKTTLKEVNALIKTTRMEQKRG